jgi:hypothetical protein
VRGGERGEGGDGEGIVLEKGFRHRDGVRRQPKGDRVKIAMSGMDSVGAFTRAGFGQNIPL